MISLPSSVYSFTPYPTFSLCTNLSLAIILASVLWLLLLSSLSTSLDSAVTLWSYNVPWFPLYSCLTPVCGNPNFSSVCKQIFPANSLAKLNAPFSNFHVLLMCFYQRNQSFCVVLICFSLSSLKDLLAQKCYVGHLRETLLLVKLLIRSSRYSITAWGINRRDGY